MASLLDLVLWPRLLVRALDDLNRIAGAVERIDQSLDPLEEDIDGLRRAFEGSNEQLAKLRNAMTPEVARIHAELLALRADAESLPFVGRKSR